MRLKFDKEYKEVGFWSFMKCMFLTQLALTGIAYGACLLILLLLI